MVDPLSYFSFQPAIHKKRINYITKEGNVLFNDALNTFYLQLYGRKERRKEMFYLTTHSTHFIYSYMEGRKEGRKCFI